MKSNHFELKNIGFDAKKIPHTAFELLSFSVF